MAGVERIVDQILEKAKQDSDAILAQAEADAEKILEVATAEANAEAGKITSKANAAAELTASRTISAIDLKKSQAMLAAKQEIIADVLDKAYEKLNSLDDDAYFEMIYKLVAAYAQKGEGEIRLSKKDLARIPNDFESKIKTASADTEGLKLSDKAADIENGFILVYGDIEENCSLKGLFDAKHNELTDLINKVIS